MGCVYLLYYIRADLFLYTFAVLEVGLVLLAVQILTKLVKIRKQLTAPPAVSLEWGRSPGGLTATPGGRYNPPPLDLIDERLATQGSSDVTPLVLQTDLPSAHELDAQQQHAEHLNPNSLSAKTGIRLEPPPFRARSYTIHAGNTLGAQIRRAMYGSHVNPHQSLFWMGARGKSFLIHLIKISLFASVVNLAVLVVNLRPMLMGLQVGCGGHACTWYLGLHPRY